MKRFDVVIVGGGTGGITVAARLKKQAPTLQVALVEPSSVHYYQPLWTLVGGGVFPKETSRKPQKDQIPIGVEWIQDYVSTFSPNENHVSLKSGETIGYRTLVVTPGMEIFWDRIPGLKESLGKNGVCSNYSYETVEYTWKAIKDFKGGTALFTFPSTPIKCGGAPQKIMYLAEDYFRKNHIRDRAIVRFVSAGQSIFAVPKYAKALSAIIAKRNIETLFRHDLVSIDGTKKIATFKGLDSTELVEMPFEMIHVTPPMGAPQFVRSSPLANADGWIDVDKYTLQHTKFSNVFGLGDASSAPTSRTGAAIRKEAPVVVTNLLQQLKGETLTAKYDGYTSCPLVTGYGKLILAEFDYDGKPAETFPFDQSKERLSMYLLKKYLLPLMYWKGMLKGHA